MAESSGLFLADGEDAGSTPWEWTAIGENGANDFSLQAAAKNHGDYGYICDFDGANQLANGYKTITAQSEIYARMYLHMSNNFDLGATFDALNIFCLRHSTTNDLVFNLRSEGANVASAWRVTGTGVTSTNSSEGFAFETWTYIDMYWKKGAGDGAVQIWVNGVSITNQTGLTTGVNDIDRISVGSLGGATPAAVDYLYIDDVKAADSGPIGAYSDSGLSWIVKQDMLVGF